MMKFSFWNWCLSHSNFLQQLSYSSSSDYPVCSIYSNLLLFLRIQSRVDISANVSPHVKRISALQFSWQILLLAVSAATIVQVSAHPCFFHSNSYISYKQVSAHPCFIHSNSYISYKPRPHIPGPLIFYLLIPMKDLYIWRIYCSRWWDTLCQYS